MRQKYTANFKLPIGWSPCNNTDGLWLLTYLCYALNNCAHPILKLRVEGDPWRLYCSSSFIRFPSLVDILPVFSLTIPNGTWISPFTYFSSKPIARKTWETMLFPLFIIVLHPCSFPSVYQHFQYFSLVTPFILSHLTLYSKILPFSSISNKKHDFPPRDKIGNENPLFFKMQQNIFYARYDSCHRYADEITF